MKSSNYMDKQITQQHFSDEEDEEEDPRFDFLPTRPLHSTNALHGSHLRGWSTMDRIDSAKATSESFGTSTYGVVLISEIDRKMKEHTDNLMHAVEGLSARVSQLETRTRQVENAVDDLKDFFECNHGRTDGKLWELENILIEVQGVIQDMRDRQEIAEAQLQLAKLTVSKGDQQKGKQNSTGQTNSAQEALSSVRQQCHQPLPNSIACPPQLANVPPNQPYQNPPPTPAATAPQLPTQLPQNIISYVPQPESYYHPPGLTPETTHQQYYLASTQQPQPPLPPSLHQPHQPALQHPPVSQVPQQPQMHPPFSMVNSQAHRPLSHQPEEVSYLASQSAYKSSQPPARIPPRRQFYAGSTQQIHDQPSIRPYSELPPGYSSLPQHSDPNNLYPYGASPSPYSISTMKPSQVSPSPSIPGSGSDYSRLPTAKILPHALPTSSSVDGGTDSGGSGKRVPVDDVVDKIVTMGFRRDLVRATVRKLTENGQSVDLNVVLDKLMNSREVQPQNGRFGQ